jgi:hypothetical protein
LASLLTGGGGGEDDGDEEERADPLTPEEAERLAAALEALRRAGA